MEVKWCGIVKSACVALQLLRRAHFCGHFRSSSLNITGFQADLVERAFSWIDAVSVPKTLHDLRKVSNRHRQWTKCFFLFFFFIYIILFTFLIDKVKLHQKKTTTDCCCHVWPSSPFWSVWVFVQRRSKRTYQFFRFSSVNPPSSPRLLTAPHLVTKCVFPLCLCRVRWQADEMGVISQVCEMKQIGQPGISPT